MTIIELVRRVFSRDHLSDWTPARAEYYERLTLESEGRYGMHFAWSRKFRVKQQQGTSAKVMRIAQGSRRA